MNTTDKLAESLRLILANYIDGRVNEAELGPTSSVNVARAVLAEHDAGYAQAPNLKCDEGERIDCEMRGRRKVLWNLLRTFDANGFEVFAASGYNDEPDSIDSPAAAMESIFGSEADRLHIRRKVVKPSESETYVVVLVVSNAPEELISDWTYFPGDRYGFHVLMNAFDAESVADSLR